MRIGIYSGSFNPVHLGHVALSDFLVQEGFVDEVWLIRSPLNPLKQGTELMSNEARQHMLELAIEGHKGLRVCTIEDELPVPNYTIVTLQTLQQRYPLHEFYLIIGADNWLIFNRWKDWDTILRDFHLIVYPRPGYPLSALATDEFPTVRLVDAPLHDISSTEIREALKKGLDISNMCDPKVVEYLHKYASC
ncbi:MAG: nicotinate-nucleotide adenylyltransferase [Bacteroidales bacterium]|nr:nicotinate-nucleotide adenylyltransferase [Bacteroidales bacterium]